MRGKAFAIYLDSPFRGITPAHAGKSVQLCLHDVVDQDHPRPCGEKRHTTATHFLAAGSPPPMRGKGKTSFTYRPDVRITPAHAGKSVARVSCQGSRLGSPPPMRGKEQRSARRTIYAGITPAHAGKSMRVYLSSHHRKDHPRPCGEKPAPDARRSAH